MFQKYVLVLSATLMGSIGWAGEFSKIAVSGTGLTDAQQARLTQIVTTRVAERTPISEAAGTLSIVYRIVSQTNELARVTAGGSRVTIVGGRFRDLLAGTGLFLRQVTWREKTFELRGGEWEFRPIMKLREAYYARHFFNWYHVATDEELTRYTEDLALWGFNSVNTILFPAINYNDDFATNPEARNLIASNLKLGRTLNELDMMFSTDAGFCSNQAPRNAPKELRTKPPKEKPQAGVSLCPMRPGTLEYQSRWGRQILEICRGTKIDAIRFWPYDEGGCCCEQCRPYGGNGYLRIVEAGSKQQREFYPDVHFMVSAWMFTDADWKSFGDYCRKHDWIDYVIVAEWDVDKALRTLPSRQPIVSFPEISMLGRSPWGGFGAVVVPQKIENNARRYRGRIAGFSLYSEGIYEDINKVLVMELNSFGEASVSADEALRSYARYEFPGTDPEDLTMLCRLLERTQSARLVDPKSEQEAVKNLNTLRAANALVDKMDAEMLPAQRKSWRWRILWLRARLDEEILRHRSRNTDRTEEWYRELCNIFRARPQDRSGHHDWVCPPIIERLK